VVSLKESHNELFFVQLKEPSEIRRSVLETLRDILELLHKFEKFKSARQEKLDKVQKLKSMVRSTNKLFGDLKAKLPQMNIKIAASVPTPKSLVEAPAQGKQPLQKKKEKPVAQKAPKREMTEVEKLESELSAIESKLKNLN